MHKLLYAAVISQVYEICNLFFKKKKQQLRSRSIWHLCGRADLLSGFMKAGHFQYAKTAVFCFAEAPLLEQTAGQVMFWHHVCRCKLRAKGSYAENCRNTIWLGRKWPQLKAHNVLAFWPTHCPLLGCGCAVVIREAFERVTSHQGQEWIRSSVISPWPSIWMW